MTDLDPAIWENETLGAAANNTRLDVIEKQAHEDRSAKLEGREPREVVADNTYPGFKAEVNPRTGTVPSNVQTVHFADEQQNDIPDASGPSDETAAGINDETETDNEANSDVADETSKEEDSEVSEGEGEQDPETVAFIGEVESDKESEPTEWK